MVPVACAGAGDLGAQEQHLVPAGQPRRPVGAPLLPYAPEQRPVGAPVGQPQPGAVLPLEGGGVRDQLPVRGVVDGVPRRFGGRAVAGVGEEGGGAALQGLDIDLRPGRRVAVVGVRQALPVRGDRRVLLVPGRVGEPLQTGAVGAHQPQVALGAAVPAAGLGGVEHHGPPVRCQPGVRRVPALGEEVHRAVGGPQVDLRGLLVTAAREHQRVAEGGRLDVEVGRTRAEQRHAGGVGVDPAETAVPGAGVRDPGVRGVGRPRRGLGTALLGGRRHREQRDHQQQRRAEPGQAAPPAGAGGSHHSSPSLSGVTPGCAPATLRRPRATRQGGGAVPGGSVWCAFGQCPRSRRRQISPLRSA